MNDMKMNPLNDDYTHTKISFHTGEFWTDQNEHSNTAYNVKQMKDVLCTLYRIYQYLYKV